MHATTLTKIAAVLVFLALGQKTGRQFAWAQEGEQIDLPHVSIYMLCRNGGDILENYTDYKEEFENYYIQNLNNVVDLSLDVEQSFEECLSFPDDGIQVYLKVNGQVTVQTSDGDVAAAESEIDEAVTSATLKEYFNENLCDNIVAWDTVIGDPTSSNKEAQSLLASQICNSPAAEATVQMTVGAIAGIVVSIVLCFLCCCAAICCVCCG